MMQLDPTQLQATIGAEESRIIRDEEGNLVGVVLRDFCTDDNALEWVNETIGYSTDLRKSIRVCAQYYLLDVCLIPFFFFPA